MTITVFPPAAHGSAAEFETSALFADLKNSAYEHLLSRIEELGAEFGRWSQAAIAQFVALELDSYIRLHAVPVNDQEAQQVVSALTRELTGLGPLQPLLDDHNVEDILINGYQDIYVSRGGMLQREASQFKDDEHVLRIVRRVLALPGPKAGRIQPDGGCAAARWRAHQRHHRAAVDRRPFGLHPQVPQGPADAAGSGQAGNIQ